MLLRPDRPNGVRACGLVADQTREGRKVRTLNVMDEFTRECLAIRVAHKPGSSDAIDVLADLFVTRGTPVHVRSDGSEFTAIAAAGWITGVGARTAFIQPGSPWENVSVRSGPRLCLVDVCQAAVRTRALPIFQGSSSATRLTG